MSKTLFQTQIKFVLGPVSKPVIIPAIKLDLGTLVSSYLLHGDFILFSVSFLTQKLIIEIRVNTVFRDN